LLNNTNKGKDNDRHNYREPGYSGIITFIKAYITKKRYILVDGKLILYKKYYHLSYINFIRQEGTFNYILGYFIYNSNIYYWLAILFFTAIEGIGDIAYIVGTKKYRL
jgi:hypothetical protein